mmetsp:Transcript_21037/g.53478  ORF Transcript_21037/g.53478 Transcript_21037/m.53478 type:complete len:454 (-) Transcript_21037:2046-3407(-)
MMNWKIWCVATSAHRPSATTDTMVEMVCALEVMGAATDASASHSDTPTAAALSAPQSLAPSPQNPTTRPSGVTVGAAGQPPPSSSTRSRLLSGVMRAHTAPRASAARSSGTCSGRASSLSNPLPVTATSHSPLSTASSALASLPAPVSDTEPSGPSITSLSGDPARMAAALRLSTPTTAWPGTMPDASAPAATPAAPVLVGRIARVTLRLSLLLLVDLVEGAVGWRPGAAAPPIAAVTAAGVPVCAAAPCAWSSADAAARLAPSCPTASAGEAHATGDADSDAGGRGEGRPDPAGLPPSAPPPPTLPRPPPLLPWPPAAAPGGVLRAARLRMEEAADTGPESGASMRQMACGCEGRMWQRCDTLMAVRRWSPVTMSARMPARCSCATTPALSGRSGLAITARPTSRSPAAFSTSSWLMEPRAGAAEGGSASPCASASTRRPSRVYRPSTASKS